MIRVKKASLLELWQRVHTYWQVHIREQSHKCTDIYSLRIIVSMVLDYSYFQPVCRFMAYLSICMLNYKTKNEIFACCSQQTVLDTSCSLLRRALHEYEYHSVSKFSRQQTEDIFLYFSMENRLLHFMQICMPGGCGFNPRWGRQHSWSWSWNIFYGHSLPSADSTRAVVSFWRKNVHNTG